MVAYVLFYNTGIGKHRSWSKDVLMNLQPYMIRVTIPGVPSSSQAPDPAYNLAHFGYNHLTDTYTCLQGHSLKTNGNWYKKHSHRNTVTTFKQYRTPACKDCPVRGKCTRAKNGRIIERNQYTENYEVKRNNVKQKEGLYKRRQQ